MEVVYRCCCGLDVHKKSIVACLRAQGKGKEVRSFGTATKDIREMASWLEESSCEMVAMESTGVYWKPVFNVLEALGLECMVVNAHHMKNVPGRKTDVKDSEWIADLLRHGLLRPSYIPGRGQRELRDATRYRKSLVEERARELNRLDKMLEGANIKISSVISDLNGVTGRALVDALILGDVTDGNIDAMLRGKTKDRRDEILAAADGALSPIQRRLLSCIVEHIDDMTRRIEEVDGIIDAGLEGYSQAIEALDGIPGIATRAAQAIVAEIGCDMRQFPTEGHLCSWAGLSPGLNESAGRRKKAKAKRGDKALKSLLVQCASSAIRVKGSYFKARFERLVVRIGRKRALVAVAHSMLIAIYHVLKDKVPFKDLGEDYYKTRDVEGRIGYHLRKLSALGFEIPSAAA